MQEYVNPRETPATQSDYMVPSVNFATEQPDYTEMTSPSHISDERPLNKALLSGATTGSPGPTDYQSAVAGEVNYPAGEEGKSAGFDQPAYEEAKTTRPAPDV